MVEPADLALGIFASHINSGKEAGITFLCMLYCKSNVCREPETTGENEWLKFHGVGSNIKAESTAVEPLFWLPRRIWISPENLNRSHFPGSK